MALANRLGHAPDVRLAHIVAELVSAMADLVQRLHLNREDLQDLIAFMTEVGDACSDQRQEWVLLADVLGLTSTIERGVVDRPAAATPNTMVGPFYRADAPRKEDGETISIDGLGERLAIVARLTDVDGSPVAGAKIEIWQANGDGLYENQEPVVQPEFNLRGVYVSGPDGVVRISTIRPKGYAIPDDGPVGKLLRRLHLSAERPAHIHFRISARDYQTLTTHVFDRSDPAIGSDPLFAVHPKLLAHFEPIGEGGFTTSLHFILAHNNPIQQTI